MIIKRAACLESVETGLAEFPVTALLGPRQCGKTTLVREIARRGASWFDCEDERDQARLASPMLALEPLRGVVVIDEIQRLPKLFETLRVLADRRPLPARFLVLGSASPDIVKGVSETLAGRVHFVDMHGFSLDEVGAGNLEKLWFRGGFPDSYLAASEPAAVRWRKTFLRTFLERDMPALGAKLPAEEMRRFWTMLAHTHGGAWNASDFCRALGWTSQSARRHLDLFSGAFMVRQLQPWFENTGKRLVKSPKVYLRDSGLLHQLLGLETPAALASHTVVGGSWEGFCIEQILASLGQPEAWFWGTQAGAELDLLLHINGRRIGFEFKHTAAPRTTKSMHVAREDLRLDRLFVVYPGADRFPLAEGIDALPLPAVAEAVRAPA